MRGMGDTGPQTRGFETHGIAGASELLSPHDCASSEDTVGVPSECLPHLAEQSATPDGAAGNVRFVVVWLFSLRLFVPLDDFDARLFDDECLCL